MSQPVTLVLTTLTSSYEQLQLNCAKLTGFLFVSHQQQRDILEEKIK